MIILVASVGGSPQPIITSIAQGKPDKICFTCSRRSAKTIDDICTKAKAENITRQINIIDDIDDINKCYADSLALLQHLREEFPEAKIIADYTGGTKSMSAGLATAAMDTKNITLGLVSGARFSLRQVTAGTQSLRTSHAIKIHLERRVLTISECFARFDYPAATSWLEETLTLPDINSEKAAMLQKWLALSRALDSWDKFDHASAWKILHNYRAEYTELLMFLEAVIWSRKKLDTTLHMEELPELSNSPKGHGYEPVEDLYLNAKRRASQGRFDDAVARLYRALELLAQIRLKLAYDIDTGNIVLNKLPPEMRPEYKNLAEGTDRIRLPLTPAFDLLAKLADFHDEPLGNLYHKQYHGKLRNFLRIRNKSLMAHGFTPIRTDDYSKEELFVKSLLDEVFSNLHLKPYAMRIQFPLSPTGGA